MGSCRQPHIRKPRTKQRLQIIEKQKHSAPRESDAHGQSDWTRPTAENHGGGRGGGQKATTKSKKRGSVTNSAACDRAAKEQGESTRALAEYPKKGAADTKQKTISEIKKTKENKERGNGGDNKKARGDTVTRRPKKTSPSAKVPPKDKAPQNIRQG